MAGGDVLVKVFACKNNVGKAGIKVKNSLNSEVHTTDSTGYATFTIPNKQISIYVNGNTAFNGYAYNIPNLLVCEV